MNRLARTCLALVLAALAAGAAAQDAPKKRVARPMESYPLHLRSRLDEDRARMLPANAANNRELQGVYYRSKLWTPGQKLNVCFFEGSPELRARIARVAKLWEKVGNLKLDFGDAGNPRLCSADETSDIRVGFEYAGYWSLVGQESITLAGQGEQSMNFEAFHTQPPAEPEFTGTVLHEFGHAIGMQHEHQNPNGKCEEEFKWDEIYAYLAQPPNNWDRAKVDFNMRRLVNSGDLRTTCTDEDKDAAGKCGIDRRSIMIYTFDDWMYKQGTQSTCYFAPNYEMSKSDVVTAAAMYPADKAAAAARRESDQKTMRETLSAAGASASSRDRALRALEALHSDRGLDYKREILQQLSAPGLR